MGGCLEAASSNTRGDGWAPRVGPSLSWSLSWERRASQSCQARPEEARAPTSGAAKGGKGEGEGGAL